MKKERKLVPGMQCQRKPSVGSRTEVAGITLVALVVTIVVLLILAGITIMYVMGDNSVFKKASDAKIETELGKIEEQAGLIYSNKLVANKGGSVSNKEIIDELNRNGNKIEIRNAGATAVESISVEPTEISMDKSKTATITVKINESEDGNNYYALVDGKYYKATFQGSKLKIEREATTTLEGNEIETASIEVVTEGELKYDNTIVANVQINQSAKTIEIGSGTTFGETTVTVKYGSKTAECKVTVEEQESDWKKIAEVAKLIGEGNGTEKYDENGTALATPKTVTNDSKTATVTIDGNEETIKVGDTFKVKVGNELRDVIVLGFNHDELVTKYDGTSNNAENVNDRQKAGITFQFKNFMTDTAKQMNSTDDNTNGWGGNPVGTNESSMRTYLEGEGIGLLSTTLQGAIKQVRKDYLLGNLSTEVKQSNDKLWLLSCSEIFSKPNSPNPGGYGYAKAKEGERYKYYVDRFPSATGSSSDILIKKTGKDGTGSANFWWLRSPSYANDRGFCIVTTTGSCSNSDANNSWFVSAGFCI